VSGIWVMATLCADQGPPAPPDAPPTILVRYCLTTLNTSDWRSRMPPQLASSR
jgi:hypothetical protein